MKRFLVLLLLLLSLPTQAQWYGAVMFNLTNNAIVVPADFWPSTVTNSAFSNAVYSAASASPPSVTAAAVTNALGYFPATNTYAALTNLLGYQPLTNSLWAITNALGYRPLTNTFDAITNSLGYLPATNGFGATNIYFSGVVTALGYTPATNSSFRAGTIAFPVGLTYTQITFLNPMPSVNYSVAVSKGDSYSPPYFFVNTKTTNSFYIRSSAAVGSADIVDWIAVMHQQ